jgi:histidinol-phosphatase (PHP family)
MSGGSDYHVHTQLCGHAVGEIEQYVERAIEVGLAEIGFADHLPLEVWRAPNPTLSMSLAQMDEYQALVARAQAAYRGRIAVKFGIEADYAPGCEQPIADFLRRYDFDYVIGSIHFLGDWGFDDEREMARWNEQTVDEVYDRYFGLLLEAIGTGLYDIVGHADLPKKFGHRPGVDLTDTYERVAAACAAAGMAVEISTAGLRKPVKELYPHPALLAACAARNVPVVINSDAHQPCDVGRDHAAAVSAAWRAGYRRTPSFAGRRIAGWLDLPSPGR